MALSDEAQARAFSQALGHIAAERAADAARGRSGAGIGVSRITRAIYEGVTPEFRGAYSSYAAVVRRAVAAEMLGRDMSGNGAYQPRLADIPIVPTLFDNTRRFHYQVVTEYAGTGTRTVSVRGWVVSDRRLTGDEVAAQVVSRLDYTVSGSGTNRRAVRTLPAGAVPLGTTILAVTRVD